MELNSSTFILEIINFLVLVWILKRFFYKPILEVIARRKAGIEATLSKAEHLQNSAENLQQQYEVRLAEWEQEKQAAQQSLSDDIRQERERQLALLRSELEAEREKEEVLITRKLDSEREKLTETALTQGAQFASRLLSVLSGPDLERRLVERLLKELETLPAEQADQLRASNGSPNNASVIVTSAYPLDESNCQAIEQACSKYLTLSGQFLYRQDADLIAGLRINIGSWVLATNLQDELKGFIGFEHER